MIALSDECLVQPSRACPSHGSHLEGAIQPVHNGSHGGRSASTKASTYSRVGCRATVVSSIPLRPRRLLIIECAAPNYTLHPRPPLSAPTSTLRHHPHPSAPPSTHRRRPPSSALQSPHHHRLRSNARPSSRRYLLCPAPRRGPRHQASILTPPSCHTLWSASLTYLHTAPHHVDIRRPPSMPLLPGPLQARPPPSTQTSHIRQARHRILQTRECTAVLYLALSDRC